MQRTIEPEIQSIYLPCFDIHDSLPAMMPSHNFALEWELMPLDVCLLRFVHSACANLRRGCFNTLPIPLNSTRIRQRSYACRSRKQINTHRKARP